MRATIQTGTAFEPGVCPATFQGVTEKYSERDERSFWSWSFTVDGATLSGASSAKLTPMSKALRWLGALTPQASGEARLRRLRRNARARSPSPSSKGSR